MYTYNIVRNIFGKYLPIIQCIRYGLVATNKISFELKWSQSAVTLPYLTPRKCLSAALGLLGWEWRKLVWPQLHISLHCHFYGDLLLLILLVAGRWAQHWGQSHAAIQWPHRGKWAPPHHLISSGQNRVLSWRNH
jgi:hypothetical protein